MTSDYSTDIDNLAAHIGNPDIDLGVCDVATRHGKTEDEVWTDFLHQHGGDLLLVDVHAFIRRFCAFPDEHALTAVTLWAAHAHMVEHFYSSPRLVFASPEPASGKTRALEVLNILVPDPMYSLSASPAAIFRTLSDRQITLLFDEVDTIWSKRGKDDNHEDLRALLNAGYKRGACIPRCVGPKHEVVEFTVYCPVALAGLGELPDTILSRSVIIRMRRRKPDEVVEPFRARQHEPQGYVLRDRLAAWAIEHGAEIGFAEPDLPEGIVDRPAEVWEPLIAIADAAGGDWPARARTACVALCRAAEDRRASLGVRLLADLRVIFDDHEAMHTEIILEQLCSGDKLEADAPWADLRGKPLSVRGLASMLKPYGVHSMKVWANGKSLQGYRREHLHDAWERYLPVPSAQVEGPEGEEGKGLEMAANLPDLPHLPETRIPERELLI